MLKGKVTGVRDFGAFVDLGGLEGMIPVSEMSHVRVGHPSDVVKVGDEVEVEMLRMEAAEPNSPDKAKQKERITLSMRSRQEDPFKAALETIKEGDRLQGKVVRLQPFGAFVELRPGVDGLVHISALSDRRIAHPRDVVKVGEDDLGHGREDRPEREAHRPAADHRGARRSVLRRGAPETGAAEACGSDRGQGRPRPAAEGGPGGRWARSTRIEPYGVFLEFPGGKG